MNKKITWNALFLLLKISKTNSEWMWIISAFWEIDGFGN